MEFIFTILVISQVLDIFFVGGRFLQIRDQESINSSDQVSHQMLTVQNKRLFNTRIISYLRPVF